MKSRILGSAMCFVLGELHARRTKPYREWFIWNQAPHPDAGGVS